MPKSDFPKEYLLGLEKNHLTKVEESLDPAERILMYTGACLNWVGDLINDKSIHWKLEDVLIDDLTLTGTNPKWNKILLDRAEGSPSKLRELFKDSSILSVFNSSQFVDVPILVVKNKDGLKILDGINRTIAAIRSGLLRIRAYVGTLEGKSAPIIEPHVVYDFIKAFQQYGGNEADFIGGLRFLANSYSNVGTLLKERFSPGWLRDEKMQKIIEDVLKGS